MTGLREDGQGEELLSIERASLGVQMVKSSCNARDLGLIPGSGRSPGEGNGGLPTPVFLPGEFHGQRGLTGCSL